MILCSYMMLLSMDLREGYKKEDSIITLFQDGETKR